MKIFLYLQGNVERHYFVDNNNIKQGVFKISCQNNIFVQGFVINYFFEGVTKYGLKYNDTSSIYTCKNKVLHGIKLEFVNYVQN